MDAALFVASGTMGNLASLLAHCERGQDVILGDESHIYHYENGSASALGGMVLHPVRTNADGTLPLDALEAAIHLPSHNYHFYHYAPPGVICLENTHNRCGGAILSPAYFAEVAAHRAPARPAGPPRRRAAVQRGGGARAAGHRLDRARVVGAVVSVEGAVGAGRVDDLRLGGVRRSRAADAQDPRRRHAAGRRHRGAGHRRADRDGGPPGRGSPQRAHPGRGHRRAARRHARPRRRCRPTSSSSGCRARPRPRRSQAAAADAACCCRTSAAAACAW